MLGRIVAKRLVGQTVVSNGRVVPMRTLYPTYHKHLVGPPRESISFAEKAFWGGFFMVGLLAAPAWILVNFESYKGK